MSARSTGRAYGGMMPEQRRAERRERLLRSAMELFTSEGYLTTKTIDICTLAGVSTRAFYEEFENKEKVLLALHDTFNAMALQRVESVLDSVDDADLTTRVSTLLDAFVGSATADPRLPRLAWVEAVGVSAELEQQRQQWLDRWASLIQSEAARAAKHGTIPDRDYRLTAIGLTGAIMGLLREWQAHDPPLGAEDIAAEIRGMMIASISRPG